MANANSNNNIFNRPFGLNIRVPNRTVQQAQETASNMVESLFTPVSDFLDTNQNVFNGDVEREISKYTRMMSSLDNTIRNVEAKSNFDTRG